MKFLKAKKFILKLVVYKAQKLLAIEIMDRDYI